MFVEKRLQNLAEFNKKARALYKAEASSVDFEQPHKVKKLINDYVRKQTQGKIKELISGLDEDTVMVLLNYVYFKGTWRMSFDPHFTLESDFYMDNERTVKVSMMKLTFLSTPYFQDEELSCIVVELKYTGNASALFILPDQGRIQQVEASLQPETLRKWRDSLRSRKNKELSLPKFSVSTDYSLQDILPQLGIREVFSTQADLSGITGSKDPQVSQETEVMAGISTDVLSRPDSILERDTEVQEKHNRTPVDNLSLTSSNNDFAFSLYKKLALKNPDKNIVFSPFSISTALAVLSLGARSKTLEEILKGLKFNLTETPEADIHQGFGHLLHMLRQPGDQVQISTGSAMYVEKHLQILAEFKEKARVLYQAEASTTDFQQPNEVKKLINDYVRKQTQGKIKELISGLDEDAVMVLVNYIYFKGKWKFPFDPRDTFESEFHMDKDRSVKVPMMKIEDLHTPYFRDEELSCTVVELKYTGNASAMFILPDEGRMQQVEASLQPETLRKWREFLRPRKIDELYMPKFSISTDYSLQDILPQLGIREVFSAQADLSGITGSKNLRVSQVVHKAVLDVAETGTEAAAATGIKIIPYCEKYISLSVRFNRPFLMFVCEANTQMTLFLAKISNPKCG
ncbi:Serine protease inhibitor A3F [Lemmus lemmus]